MDYVLWARPTTFAKPTILIHAFTSFEEKKWINAAFLVITSHASVGIVSVSPTFQPLNSQTGEGQFHIQGYLILNIYI